MLFLMAVTNYYEAVESECDTAHHGILNLSLACRHIKNAVLATCMNIDGFSRSL
jgi:hypothetical protein